MADTQWTLDGELKRIAGVGDLTDALIALHLAEHDTSAVDLETMRDWYRSGEETYALHFSVCSEGARSTYVMKACVAYDGVNSLADIFADWLKRRETLESLGVGVPRLHGARAATLVEEYIPYELPSAIRLSPTSDDLLTAIGGTAARLVNAGFVPLTASDWRSRGTDVVVVDFGQDLGPPGMAAPGHESGLLSEVIDNLMRSGVQLTPKALTTIGEGYENSVEA